MTTSANIDEIRERRLEALINMIEDAYQVDGYGVAELIGMKKQTWTKEMRKPWGKKSCTLFFGLAELTTVRLSWLMCEDLEKAEI